MSSFSRCAVFCLKASLCLTALTNFTISKLAPASAQTTPQIAPTIPTFTVEQGGFSAVITYITPSSYVSSIGAEKVAPSGTYLAGIDGYGTYIAKGSAYIDPITHMSVPSIVLFTGPTVPLPAGVGNPVGASLNYRLNSPNITLDEYTGIIRAVTPGLF